MIALLAVLSTMGMLMHHSISLHTYIVQVPRTCGILSHFVYINYVQMDFQPTRYSGSNKPCYAHYHHQLLL
jgi:hypothetical protein